jgi:hypothetical protein
MPTRRVLKSVLHGFLGTFASRYSDYHGYWVFGFVVEQLDVWDIDLLEETARAESPGDCARELARATFRDQLAKHGLERRAVRVATLRIERGRAMEGLAGRGERGGFVVSFRVTVDADTGRRFECARSLFVAPHDPRWESKSTR